MQREATYLEEMFLMKKSLHFHREKKHLIPRTLIDARKTAYGKYICDIRQKKEILGPIHVTFNKICRLSSIDGVHLQFFF